MVTIEEATANRKLESVLMDSKAGMVVGKSKLTMPYIYTEIMAITINVNIFKRNVTIEYQPAFSIGHPHKTTTGVPKINGAQEVISIDSELTMLVANNRTGIVSIKLIQK